MVDIASRQTMGIRQAATYDAMSRGQESAYCDQTDRFAIPNGKGKVVSAYTTVCTTLGTSVVSYVFVHNETDRPRSDNLVFRDTESGVAGVELSWMDPTHVSVKVHDARYIDINIMEEQADGILIRYFIQKIVS